MFYYGIGLHLLVQHNQKDGNEKVLKRQYAHF